MDTLEAARDDDDKLLTSEEVAERWHMTPFTLSKKWQSLGLTPIKVGKRHLHRLSNVREVERRHTVGAAE
jgi:hypothetical protein